MTAYKIEGFVFPGYEPVRAAFEDNFIKGREAHSQCCAYVNGELVVDLYGTYGKENAGYDGDSLQNVFSSTKSVAAICIALLVDKDLISYSDPVVKYWPELKDKNELTLSQILRHESGLQKFSYSFKPQELLRSSVKNENSIGRIIESEIPEFPHNQTSKRLYHTITRGWILNEIFRRVHPEGLTMGEYVQKELFEGFLTADIHIGFHSENDPALQRVFDLETRSVTSVVWHSCQPKFLSTKKVDLAPLDILRFMKRVKDNRTNSMTDSPKPEAIDVMDPNPLHIQSKLMVFNRKDIRMGEIPSANGSCSARGLAKLASLMANKGQFGDYRFISEETWNKMHSEPIHEIDLALGNPTNFTLGGVNKFIHESNSNYDYSESSKNREGFYGWMGMGGSVFQWHPEYRIGFAYAPTFMEWHDFPNLKASILQKVLVECVKTNVAKSEE